MMSFFPYSSAMLMKQLSGVRLVILTLCIVGTYVDISVERIHLT